MTFCWGLISRANNGAAFNGNNVYSLFKMFRTPEVWPLRYVHYWRIWCWRVALWDYGIETNKDRKSTERFCRRLFLLKRLASDLSEEHVSADWGGLHLQTPLGKFSEFLLLSLRALGESIESREVSRKFIKIESIQGSRNSRRELPDFESSQQVSVVYRRYLIWCLIY